MKHTLLFLLFIFTLSAPAMAQENTDSILSLGLMKPLEYSQNNEEISDIKYLEIRQREDGAYDIEIKFNEPAGYDTIPDIQDYSNSDYIIFKIENIKRTAFHRWFGFVERIGYVSTGTLSNISFEGDGTAFFDDKATGTIEINESNNTVKVEINMGIHRSEMNLVLSWENNAPDNELVFLSPLVKTGMNAYTGDFRSWTLTRQDVIEMLPKMEKVEREVQYALCYDFSHSYTATVRYQGVPYQMTVGAGSYIILSGNGQELCFIFREKTGYFPAPCDCCEEE